MIQKVHSMGLNIFAGSWGQRPSGASMAVTAIFPQKVIMVHEIKK